jgi:hypothetical protein
MRFLLWPAALGAGVMAVLLAAPPTVQGCGPGGYGWSAPAGRTVYYYVPASSGYRTYYYTPADTGGYTLVPAGDQNRAYYYTPSGESLRSYYYVPESSGYSGYTPRSSSFSSGTSDIFDRWKPDEHSLFYPRGG